MPWFAQQVPPGFWEKALDQVPGLAVVCVGGIVIVCWFLKTMRSTVEQFLAHITTNEERQAKRDTEHAVQNAGAFAKMSAAMDRNTEALGLNSAALATAARAAAEHRDLVSEFHEYRLQAAGFHKENLDAHKETRHAMASWQHGESMRKAAEEALRKQAEGQS